MSEDGVRANDAELVQRVRAGDREAFGALVDRYRDMVYGLGYHLTGDFEAARDLAQEAFVQAYRKLSDLREPERFAGWLRQIAVNLHRMQRRRRQPDAVALDEEAQAAREHWPSEIEVAVREALGRLRPPERLTITLHYIDGYSHAEIGDFLGVRAETVKARLARARERLREEMASMVEESFERRALGDEFRAEVLREIDRLAETVRQAAPDELRHLVASRYGALLREVRDGLPEALARRADAGEAIAVNALPPPLRGKVAEAAQWLWVDRILWHLIGPYDFHYQWLDDDTMISIEQREDGQRLLAFRSRGSMWSTTLPQEAARYRAARGQRRAPRKAIPLDCEGLLAALNQDISRVAVDLPATLARHLPAPPAELYADLKGECDRVALAWLDALSPEERERLTSGGAIALSDFGERPQALLRERIALGRAARALPRLAAPPAWVAQVGESEITFRCKKEDGTLGTDLRLTSPLGTHITVSSWGAPSVSGEDWGDVPEVELRPDPPK
jgi:RNA polymerase sigma-70 factor (ECF subfamily)